MPEDWTLRWELSQKQFDHARSGAASISTGALILIVGFASSLLLAEREVISFACEAERAWANAVLLGAFLLAVSLMYWRRISFHREDALKHLGILTELAKAVPGLGDGLDPPARLSMEFKYRPILLIAFLAALYGATLYDSDEQCEKCCCELCPATGANPS